MAYPLDESAKGVFVIASTPFADDGSLDLASTERLMDFYLDKGVRGITLLGSPEETGLLSFDEAQRLIQRCVDHVAGRVPVLVGLDASSNEEALGLARDAMTRGAAGVLARPPRYLEDEEQLRAWFFALCRALGPKTPVCFHDVPEVSTVYASVSTLLTLVSECAQLVMLVHDVCPGLRKLTEFRRRSASQGQRRLSIMGGNGGLFLPLELGRGANGAMTGFAYPEMLVQVCQRYDAGEARGAEDLYDAFLPLVRYERQPGFGSAVRREILRRRGAIASAFTRRPGLTLDADDRVELDRLIDRMQRRLEAAK